MAGLQGLWVLPWWGYILAVLVLTHVTIASVTIFLHRHQAHRALDLHPLVSHFFRFWLWLTTGQITKEWASIHRKHHARCETADDPHSPQVLGLRKVLWQGYELYRAAASDRSIMEKFGHGTPDDWLERNLYTPRNTWGIVLMAVIDLLLFGVNGIWIWAVQMIWIPFFAAGVINGVGHYFGYRNFECQDASTNVLPIGILIGGEELHNNHHTFGSSAKLSVKWWEFDIGWAYIRTLELLRLATVRRVAPSIKLNGDKHIADMETLQAVISNRYLVAASYARSLKTTCRTEIQRLRQEGQLLGSLHGKKLMRELRTWLKQDAKDTPAAQRQQLDALLAESKLLQTVYGMRQELAMIWERSSQSKEQLLRQLQDWCQRAEASGIESLRQFSLQLRCYSV